MSGTILDTGGEPWTVTWTPPDQVSITQSSNISSIIFDVGSSSAEVVDFTAPSPPSSQNFGLVEDPVSIEIINDTGSVMAGFGLVLDDVLPTPPFDTTDIHPDNYAHFHNVQTNTFAGETLQVFAPPGVPASFGTIGATPAPNYILAEGDIPAGATLTGSDLAIHQEEQPAINNSFSLVLFPFLACFAEETLIQTARGNERIEDLHAGDHVLTAAGEYRPIRWIGVRNVACRQHPEPKKVWPIRIQAGSFGADKPYQDLLLSPDHAIYIKGVLIPVKYLLLDPIIQQKAVDHVTYYHLELETHDVVFANGLAAETYLDTGQRSAFANSPKTLQLYPKFSPAGWEAAQIREALGFAPLVVVGDEVEQVRACLAETAQRQTLCRTRNSVYGRRRA